LPTLKDLPSLVDRLSARDRARFARLFQVATAPARLVLPPNMRGWVQEAFGSAEAVEEQLVLRVTNLATGEEALFNPLRAARPSEVHLDAYGLADLAALLETDRSDPFCRPLEHTPEDVFGRVYGRFCVTASNIAKLDAFHGVVIFHEHNPLRFDREQLADYLRTGLAWGERVLALDPSAVYWLLWWNALWKSGASIVHGHAQVVAARERPYARIEQLRAAAATYHGRHGARYFDDLVAVHDALGLSYHYRSATLLATLTPIKEREVWLLDRGGLTEALVDLTYRVLACYTRRLGVQSFNLVYVRPPLGSAPAAHEDWAGFPHIIRVVDRGPLSSPMSDIGGVELCGSPGIASDPFELQAQLSGWVNEAR
jgi:hypothetical protein